MRCPRGDTVSRTHLVVPSLLALLLAPSAAALTRGTSLRVDGSSASPRL
jgi:hypothetical protein